MKPKENICEFVFLGHGHKTASCILVNADRKVKDKAIDYPIQIIFAIKKQNVDCNYFVIHSN